MTTLTDTASPAVEILGLAANIVDGKRGVDHGPRERSFAMIADLWSAYLGIDIEAYQVAQMMVLLKVARSQCGESTRQDHYIDSAGYSALAGELALGSVITA